MTNDIVRVYLCHQRKFIYFNRKHQEVIVGEKKEKSMHYWEVKGGMSYLRVQVFE